MERDGERRGGEERVKAVSSINLNPSICRGAPHLIGSARRDLINLTRPAHTHTPHTHTTSTHTHTHHQYQRQTHKQCYKYTLYRHSDPRNHITISMSSLYHAKK